MVAAMARLHRSIMKVIDSNDPKLHSINIQSALRLLMTHLEFDNIQVNEPRFLVLAETSREVLKGIYKAFDDYRAGCGKAWGGTGVEASKVITRK